nr:mycofactocin-coupled SDR family oxidoreductase [Rhodococcus wratislaviensis]GLK33347.1 putative short-chain type dehydrogenase/reductase [Rhodococcus wratislaviensis]
MTRRFEGKVALVTGAARGQGRNHAIRLAQEGADIVAIDLCRDIDSVPYQLARPDDMAKTVGAVEETGRRIVSAVVDVRDGSAVSAAVDQAVQEVGRLDLVIANAGVASFSPVEDMSDSMWSDMIGTNLTGVFNTARASIPHLKEGGPGGVIIATGSVASFKSSGNLAHYSAAKHGLMGLVKSLAIELGPDQIRVNAVLPTTVDTNMAQSQALYDLFFPDRKNPGRQDLAEFMPGLHVLPIPWVTVDDISNAVLFLCSDEARFVTGTDLPVDAGWLIR